MPAIRELLHVLMDRFVHLHVRKYSNKYEKLIDFSSYRFDVGHCVVRRS